MAFKCDHTKETIHAPPTPAKKKPFSVEVDFERYAPLLDDPNLSEDQKREFLQAVWSIVTAFVDLGFDVGPVKTGCGKHAETRGNQTVSASSPVYLKHRKLMKEFIAADGEKEAGP
ncbi:MAG: hypothetical protein AAGA72_05175 [Pseudomonadota bacterium]